MRTIAILLLLTVCAHGAVVENVTPVNQHVTDTPLAFPVRTNNAPSIDGKLNDVCWKAATKIGPLIHNETGLPATEACVGYLCYDDEAVYIAIDAVEGQMEHLRGKPQGDKQDVWSGDELEFFFAPHGDGSTLYQFCVGALHGQRYDYSNELGKKYHYDGWLSAVHLDKQNQRFYIEVKIPFAAFNMDGPPAGALWGFNIGRQNTNTRMPDLDWPGADSDNSTELSQWSSTGTAFHVISKFGRLFFGTPEQFSSRREAIGVEMVLDRFAYDKLERDAHAVVILRTGGRDISDMKLKVALEHDGGKTIEQDLGTPPGETLSFLLPLNSLRPGKYTVKATTTASDTEPATASWPFELTGNGLAPGVTRSGRIPLKLPPRDADKKDFAWPVRTGVPFPPGALDDPNKVQLLINGKPAPCQTSVRARWSPRGPIRWLGLTFVATDPDATYELAYGGASSPAPKQPVTVKNGVISTGSLSIHIDQRGITRAELNGKTVGVGTDATAPYIVDESGTTYSTAWSDDVSIEVEESGPVHAVVRVEGWFASKTGKKLCKFTTYYEVFAGLPQVFVDHAVVITFDTRKNKLKDIGFPVAASGNRYAIGIEDSKALTGARSKRVFALQNRHDRYVVGGAATHEGGKLSGWADAGTDNAGVTLSAQYVWQRHPSSFSIDDAKLTYHLWPPDIGDVYTDEEELARQNIYKFFYAHEGPALDFQLPQAYFDKVREYAAQESFYLIYAKRGLEANAQGVAINEPFVITYRDQPVDAAKAASLTQLAEQNPHAIADPNWISSTGAMGPLAAVDREAFPGMARFLGPAFLSMAWAPLIINDEYGMFNFGDVHTYFHWWKKPPRAGIHRVWLSHHYGQTDLIWLLYAYYGEPQYLEWARINNHHTMNINIVHYEDPEHPLEYHNLGAFYHVKGLVHWGGDTQIAGHLAWPTYLNWSWLLTGNRRARDVSNEWVTGLTKSRPSGFTGREGQNALGHMAHFYAHRWDPQVLLVMQDFATTMLSTPLEKQHAAWWNPATWYSYYNLRRDPLALQRISVAAYRNANRAEHMNGYLYLLTGDEKYLDELNSIYESANRQFTEAGHVYDGISQPSFLDTGGQIHRLMVIQKALEKAGRRVVPDVQRPRPLHVETGKMTREGAKQYTLGVMKQEGKAITIDTGGDAELAGKIAITGPGQVNVSAITAEASPGLYTIFVPSPKPVKVKGAKAFFYVKAPAYHGLPKDSLVRIEPMEGSGPITLSFNQVSGDPVRLTVLDDQLNEVTSASSWFKYQRKFQKLMIPEGGPYWLAVPLGVTFSVDRDVKIMPHAGSSVDDR